VLVVTIRIGAHESIAGGLHLAFERAQADGAESLQIFTKSGRQWAGKPISDEDAHAFRKAQANCGLPVIAHDSYLINLGADPGEGRDKSVGAFRDELERCEKLGIRWLVAHPGVHEDEATGIRNIADGIRQTLDETAGAEAGVLLEITAGQGNCIGYRFGHPRGLLHEIGRPERTGVCLDTCHLFAAGYDLVTPEGYARTMDELGRLVGFERVRAIHLNDAVKGHGSRVDRHANIGKGTLGEKPFERLVRDSRFHDVVAVLETPPGHWREEIARLRSLRDGNRSQKVDLLTVGRGSNRGRRRNDEQPQTSHDKSRPLAKRAARATRPAAERPSSRR